VSLIDTHCHIDFDSYADDREALLSRAAEAGVTRIINPAIDLETSTGIIKQAARYPSVYATVGIHPNSTADFDASMIERLAELAAQGRIVSVGEIGLDYYWDKSPKHKQFEAFEAQLALAARLELPVIIHNRNASEDTIPILENWAKTLPPALRERPGVLHSVSAPQELAERALACGFYLGFTGPITYKNAEDTRRLAAATPLDRILVETDGPFLTPVPHRGKRNEPAYIPLIIERLAAVKQISVEAMGQATTDNAVRLFKLDSP
jgi:TatD DNase family protein